MDAVTSPMQELEVAALDSTSIQLWADLVLSNGNTLHVDLRGMKAASGWNGQLTCKESGAGVTRNPPGRTIKSLRDGLRKVVAAYSPAVLQPDSIGLKVRKGPISAGQLRPLAIRAWHEALGLPIPSRDDLVAKTKSARPARGTKEDDLVALLKSGPAGVQAFNSRPLSERNHSDLKSANLSGCMLDRIRLASASLIGIDLSGASLVDTRFGWSIASRGLKKARLVGADLSRSYFEASACVEADFTRARLNGVLFQRCNLRGCRFIGADLSQARIIGSNLCGADFTDAEASGWIVEGGEFDELTKWPRKFPIPASLAWRGAGVDPRLAPTRKEKARPGPTDFEGFLERLKQVTDSAKLDKALAMLKAERFRLFARVHDDHLAGVVKSQSEATLVYSCRITSAGTYSCCTQNLNMCGGLRGAPCKHLLVLILGLAMAGEIDPGTAHEWTLASRGRKPQLDKDAMTETLLQYKGAEAGEIDWRPTDTLPEDFYTM